jgi:hypothetical protein
MEIMGFDTKTPSCIECTNYETVTVVEDSKDITNFHCSKCDISFTRRDAFNKFLDTLKDLGPLFEEIDYSKVNKRLESEFSGLKIERTFGMLPTQSEGRYKDKGFYFRFRWNTARLQIGEFLGHDKLPGNPVIIEKEDVTDEAYAGVLEAEEFYLLFSELLTQYLEGENA